MVEAYRMLRADAKSETSALPAGLDWDRLSAEMRANIHVGLAAGECVTPPGKQGRVEGDKKFTVSSVWRPAAVVAALAVVVTGAWWLNVPASDRQALAHIMRGLPARSGEDGGAVVVATAAGIEFRENGSSLGVGMSGAKPGEVSLSVGGSASARFVDEDMAQVTITTVSYVQ